VIIAALLLLLAVVTGISTYIVAGWFSGIDFAITDLLGSDDEEQE
jgi:hypothetical protein